MSNKEELILKAVKRGKYASLFGFLVEKDENQIEMTFSELEEVLGFKLPDSAYLYRPWWANQAKSGHSQAMAWDTAGWKTKLVDLEKESLMFERIVAKNEIDTAASTSTGTSDNQEYWVYENWTHNKAIIHQGDCSYCNNGKGMHAGSTNRNGQWLGPFNTTVQANKVAKSTERDEVRPCQNCV